MNPFKNLDNKDKKMIARIVGSVLLTIALAHFTANGIFYLLPYLLIGYDILYKTFVGIRGKDLFDENFLMTVATIGAWFLGEYEECVAVMVLYQIGELFQRKAVQHSRKNIADLMDLCPDYANIEVDGVIQKVDPDEIEIGSTILLLPGEKNPLDGVVTEGTSLIDMRALTGESVPKEVSPGETVFSGCVNLSGVLKIQTTKKSEDSTAAKILELVEDASIKKSRSETFMTRFAKVYTPAVCLIALILAVGIPLVRMAMGELPLWSEWISRALILLVISCPCALVISIPMTFFAGIGACSSRGILVKSSGDLESLPQMKKIVFDKTGTLTKGKFEVIAIHPEKISPEDLLHLTAHVERYSTHPIAAALRQAFEERRDKSHLCSCDIADIQEWAGHGISAKINGQKICVGNEIFMHSLGLEPSHCDKEGHQSATIVHVSIDGQYAGHILVSDVPKETSKRALQILKKLGIEETIMLTGDNEVVAQSVAKELGISKVFSHLLPVDKVQKVEELLKQKQNEKTKIAFAGDGINDAPVLARVDVGFAMGALGSDAAIEAADVVLMNDDPLQIAQSMNIAKKTISIVHQNIGLALGIKGLCLILGAVGIANMWLAIFADVGVMILAVLNSMRALSVEKI